MACKLQQHGAFVLGFGLLAGVALVPAANAQSAKYQEAPALAEQVKAGKLPAVELRLPEQPLLVPVERVGQYGGV